MTFNYFMEIEGFILSIVRHRTYAFEKSVARSKKSPDTPKTMAIALERASMV